MGVLAMKTLGEGAFFKKTPGEEDAAIVPGRLSASEALYFVWSLPVSVIITGPDNAEMLREKIALARSFTKIDEDERQQLVAKVADVAGGGKLEDYKYG